MYLGKISVVVSFHLVIEHFAFLRVRVGNQLVLKRRRKDIEIGERDREREIEVKREREIERERET